MTKSEYDHWKRVTAQSTQNWILDEITLHNWNSYLFYKGGEDGTYIEINPSGRATVGHYEGALPHIGEALFIAKHTKVLADNAEEALKIVTERMGLQFLRNLVGIRV